MFTHALLFVASLALLDHNDGRHSAIANAGDTNADGVNDVVVASRDGMLPELVWLFSGKDGSLLRTWKGEEAGDRFGRSLASAGDVNGDGCADVIVGARGYAHVLSGRGGLLLHRLAPEGGGADFGFCVAGGLDLDGDGSTDLAVAGGGSTFVFSGRSGTVVESFPGRSDSVALVPDVTSDRLADILVPYGVNVIELRSGADGALVATMRASARADRFQDPSRVGWVVGSAGDFDGDGSADFFATTVNDCLCVFSGKSFELLREVEYPTGNLAARGSSVDLIGDLDGDGRNDLVLGANESDSWGPEMVDGAGAWFETSSGEPCADWPRGMMVGVTAWQVLWGDDAGVDACGLGDLDGDGSPEVGVAFARKNIVRIVSARDLRLVREIDLNRLRALEPDSRAAPLERLYTEEE